MLSLRKRDLGDKVTKDKGHTTRLLERLRRIFTKYPEVLIAYLYGSYAKGKESSLSDIDIAIIMKNKENFVNLLADIARELKIPEDKVSITDLLLVDPLLRLKILSEGLEIVNKGINLNSLIQPETIEIYELEQTSSTRSWLRGNPIDFIVVRDIISRITEDIRDLNELLQLGYEKVINNKHMRKSFERTLQTLIESMLDLLRHIVAGLNLGIAACYRDYVDFARNGGVISDEIASYLKSLIPIRHALVHRYRRLNYEELWKEAYTILDIANKLIDEVREFLKSKYS
jgi:uncharacterized protein YutE (UPF0331/DUF86 family)/predicted nucleotidyltransferase